MPLGQKKGKAKHLFFTSHAIRLGASQKLAYSILSKISERHLPQVIALKMRVMLPLRQQDISLVLGSITQWPKQVVPSHNAQQKLSSQRQGSHRQYLHILPCPASHPGFSWVETKGQIPSQDQGDPMYSDSHPFMQPPDSYVGHTDLPLFPACSQYHHLHSRTLPVSLICNHWIPAPCPNLGLHLH